MRIPTWRIINPGLCPDRPMEPLCIEQQHPQIEDLSWDRAGRCKTGEWPSYIYPQVLFESFYVYTSMADYALLY